MVRRLAAVLATIVLAEIAAQGYYALTTGDILARRAALPIFEADPTRCYRLRGGLAYRHRTPEFDVTLYTNDEGMRTGADRRPIAEKRPGVFRVLFLGTSYAFGWGSEYEQSYAALVGAGLARSGREVEVVNLGTPGQPAGGQLCWLRDQGRRVRPDLVIHTVFADPAVIAASCEEDRNCPQVADGYLVRRGHVPGFVGELGKRSALVFYGWYIGHRYLAPAPSVHGPAGEPPDGLRLPDQGTDALPPRYATFVSSVRDAVGEPVQVVFVVIPPSFAVHPGDASRWGPIGPYGEVFRSVTRAAASALEANGIAFVDTTPALERAAANGRMFYWLDTHLTPAGNRVVAEVLLSRLSPLAASPAAPAAP
jgi:hypothetical protein